MAKMVAKTASNGFHEARCEETAHMGLKILTASELKSMLERKGVFMGSSIEEVRNFIRTKFPGLSYGEEESLIKNNVFQCELAGRW